MSEMNEDLTGKFSDLKVEAGKEQNKNAEQANEIESNHDGTEVADESSSKLCNLIVNYLPHDFDEPTLKDLFSPYGEIASVKVVRDRHGHSVGYGFVKYRSEDDAMYAIEKMNGYAIGGKNLKVSIARPAIQEIRNCKLYVTNLPREWSENNVIDLFKQFGDIIECRVLKAENGETNRGVAFVQFNLKSQADSALSLNGSVLPGARQHLVVKSADDQHGRRDHFFYHHGNDSGQHREHSGGFHSPAVQHVQRSRSDSYGGSRSSAHNIAPPGRIRANSDAHVYRGQGRARGGTDARDPQQHYYPQMPYDTTATNLLDYTYNPGQMYFYPPPQPGFVYPSQGYPMMYTVMPGNGGGAAAEFGQQGGVVPMMGYVPVPNVVPLPVAATEGVSGDEKSTPSQLSQPPPQYPQYSYNITPPYAYAPPQVTTTAATAPLTASNLFKNQQKQMKQQQQHNADPVSVTATAAVSPIVLGKSNAANKMHLGVEKKILKRDEKELVKQQQL